MSQSLFAPNVTLNCDIPNAQSEERPYLLTTFPLCRDVAVKDHVQCLSQLPGRGFALPVMTHGSDVDCLGVETAVEEFL